MKRIVIFGVIGVLAVVAAMGAWHLANNDDAGSKFQTAPVSRTNLVATIGATGTLAPEELVDVGAQVAGQIFTFGKDKDGKIIDYGSEVEQGTILAQIDDSLYAADVSTAKAQLAQAQAGEVRAQADILQIQAKLDQAQRDWERAQKLGPSEALAPSAYDAYKATYESAQANVGVTKAALDQAKASVAQAQAVLARAQRNLSYCTIKSPVKGVIIDRRVNIGQTVVSSLNAPSLFLIAKDLRRMQVWVQVNEADVGNIQPGQPVTFTVDAFPGQTFQGEVAKVRLNATVTQNVVTYTVIVTTDNSNGKLLPYLTANVQFITGRQDNVLAVPNAALRWLPQKDQVAEEYRQGGGGAKGQVSHPSPKTEHPAQQQGTLWVTQGDHVRPVHVTVGLTDGAMTAISGKDVTEGMTVVTGETSPKMASNTQPGASPFTPQIGRAHQGANRGSR